MIVPKIIMGLDPGSQHTGVGFVELPDKANDAIKILHLDVIDLKKQKTLSSRLALLSQVLEQHLKNFQPNAVAIENVFLGKNAATAFVLGQARGVCVAMAGRFDLVVHEYAPRKIKKLLTGNGAADKLEIQQHLKVFYGIQHPSADACDALAIAICHAQQLQLQERFGLGKEMSTL